MFKWGWAHATYLKDWAHHQCTFGKTVSFIVFIFWYTNKILTRDCFIYLEKRKQWVIKQRFDLREMNKVYSQGPTDRFDFEKRRRQMKMLSLCFATAVPLIGTVWTSFSCTFKSTVTTHGNRSLQKSTVGNIFTLHLYDTAQWCQTSVGGRWFYVCLADRVLAPNEALWLSVRHLF